MLVYQMQDDSVMLPSQGSKEDSKVERRGSRDWVPHEAKMLFASLIFEVTQNQLDEKRSREAEFHDPWADMPLVAREFHRGADKHALAVGEVGSYEVAAVGDDGAILFRDKAQPDAEESGSN